MVSNMLPTLPCSPTRSNLPYSASPQPIVSDTKTELSCHPCNIIAGNNSAIAARAVMATYSISSTNDSSGKSLIASIGAQGQALVKQSMHIAMSLK